MKPVAALFCRSDSIYKTIPGVDVWDEARDARLWPGGCPVVAHPPCRAWGRLRHMANPVEGERELAILAVDLARRNGGVVEHPAASRLWPELGLPEPNKGPDAWGGWTLVLHQHWLGHAAEKATRLYIVGVHPNEIPLIPLRLDVPEYVIGDTGRKGSGTYRPEIPKADRERTPEAMAHWLIELARKSTV